MTSKELAVKIAAILDNKKAKDVTLVDIEKLSIVADYFVICSGNSTLQVRALSDEVEEQLENMGIAKLRQDGYRESRWVVMDYGNVIVHIFHAQEREVYNIERLWADGNNIERFSAAQSETTF